MGDHAASVAKQARKLAPHAAAAATTSSCREMGELAADQVRGVLRALVDVDEATAREVAALDDEIDDLYHAIFDEVLELMRADPANVERGTRILFAAHYLERIGDRVTNIAEDVVFLATGDDRGPQPRERRRPASDAPIRVIFVCTGNSARSDDGRGAAAHARRRRIEVYSAGIGAEGRQPDDGPGARGGRARPQAARSKSVNEFLGQRFDYVVTVCDQARAGLPGVPGRRRIAALGLRTRPKVEGSEEVRLARVPSVFTRWAADPQFLPIARAVRGGATARRAGMIRG